MSTEKTEDRQTHVTKERDELEYASNDLVDIVMSLEEKLKNVLTNESSPPDSPDAVAKEIVPLAENLRRSRDKVQSQVIKIRSIHSRLEN